MAGSSEIAKLRREIEVLVQLVRQDRPGAKATMTAKDRRALKAEIEWCIQELDELRTRLTG